MRKLSILILLAVAGMTLCGLFSSRKVLEIPSETMAAPVVPEPEISPFDQAVEIIKKYEGLHSPRHWPLVGYGHKVLPGEKFSPRYALPQTEAEAILRKDLLKNCAIFRDFGADSLLLGVLAYNIGSGATMRSGIVRKLRNGDRDIKSIYLAHCRYRGKVHSQLRQRRAEEFAKLFIANPEIIETNLSDKRLTLSPPEVSVAAQ